MNNEMNNNINPNEQTNNANVENNNIENNEPIVPVVDIGNTVQTNQTNPVTNNVDENNSNAETSQEEVVEEKEQEQEQTSPEEEPDTNPPIIPPSPGLHIHNVESSDDDDDDEDDTEPATQAGVDLSTVKTRVKRRKHKGVVEFRLLNRIAFFLITFGIITLIVTGLYLYLSTRTTKSGTALALGDIIYTKNDVNNYALITWSAETNMELQRNANYVPFSYYSTNPYQQAPAQTPSQGSSQSSFQSSSSSSSSQSSQQQIQQQTQQQAQQQSYQKTNLVPQPTMASIFEPPVVTPLVNTTTTVPKNNVGTYDQFVRIKIEVKNRSKSVLSFRTYNRLYLIDTSYQYITECYTAGELSSYQVSDTFPSSIKPGESEEGYIYCPTTINYLPILQIVSATDQTQITSDGSIIGSGANTFYIILSKAKKR